MCYYFFIDIRVLRCIEWVSCLGYGFCDWKVIGLLCSSMIYVDISLCCVGISLSL